MHVCKQDALLCTQAGPGGAHALRICENRLGCRSGPAPGRPEVPGGHRCPAHAPGWPCTGYTCTLTWAAAEKAGWQPGMHNSMTDYVMQVPENSQVALFNRQRSSKA